MVIEVWFEETKKGGANKEGNPHAQAVKTELGKLRPLKLTANTLKEYCYAVIRPKIVKFLASQLYSPLYTSIQVLPESI